MGINERKLLPVVKKRQSRSSSLEQPVQRRAHEALLIGARRPRRTGLLGLRFGCRRCHKEPVFGANWSRIDLVDRACIVAAPIWNAVRSVGTRLQVVDANGKF